VPVEVKHYYAKHALSRPEDDPMRHPKVGASYQVSRWDETMGVTDDDLAQLRRELSRTVYAVLADAGLDIAPSNGSGPYFEDAYFDAETVDVPDEFEPPSLDLTHLRHEQESIVIRHLSDGGFSPVEEEALGYLVADGGTISPADIAEATGRHVGSVRRALRRMEEMVERKYGEVSLRSTYVAELVHDAVQDAKDAVTRLTNTTGKALMAAERGIDERTSAWLAWASKHDVSHADERDARMKMRFGEVDSLKEVHETIQRGFRLWTQVGRDGAVFREATATFRKDGQPMHVDAWRAV
jgi:hypothetical protein